VSWTLSSLKIRSKSILRSIQ